MSVGFFPLDEQLAVSARVWSEGVERLAVWLSGAVSSFALVEEVLAQVGQVSLSCASIWRVTQAAGQQFQALEAVERVRANALPAQWTPPSRAEVSDQRMGVALDGVLVNLRTEGWKEVKLATVFDLVLTSTPKPQTQEAVERAQAVHTSYVAHLGGPETLGELAWAEARRRGWEQAQDSQVLGDGAVWIWQQAALHFGTSQQTVDWYHALQHLTEAARLLKGEGTPAFTRWRTRSETLLYQGQAARIADALDQAATRPGSEGLAREAAYFRTHQRRMNYLELRENGWLIGSGVVESGAKQIKARFCGPGMRWSRKGAEHLLPIRTAVMSHRFDATWAAAKNLPPL
ncbi:MAG: hypothetical protein WAL47_00950 [Pyrinomonadaceae bacterium]